MNNKNDASKNSLKYKGHMTENAHYLTKKLQNRNFLWKHVTLR